MHIREMHNILAECCKAIRGLYPVGRLEDEPYWERVTNTLTQLGEKYPSELCHDTIQKIVKCLEKESKALTAQELKNTDQIEEVVA